MKHVLRSLPGHLAFVLGTLVATFLCVTQLSSFFYEGWGQLLSTATLGFLLSVLFVAVILAALRWPSGGGLLLMAFALAGGSVWLWRQWAYDGLSAIVLTTAVVFFGPVLILGVLFLLEARHRRLLAAEGVRPSARWLARNYRSLVAVGIPVIAVAVISFQRVPDLLARHDDGLRGARRLEGNGVALVWAPAGPGWNQQLPGGGYPSWNEIAHYGSPPVGLKSSNVSPLPIVAADHMVQAGICGYLNEDGTALLSEPTHFWRLPTPDEVVRSLTKGGENAGCTMDARSPHAACRVPPDKETPLWAPDQAPIYYWTSEAPDPTHAVGVNYTGGVTLHSKSAGGVGFRCVKPAQ